MTGFPPLRCLIAGFKNKPILVVGDLMLDHYIRGSVSRISPEAPVPVVKVASESFLPGGAGNVASNLSSLGAQVSLIGVIGEDEAAGRLTSELQGKNIDVQHLLRDGGRVTSQKCRVVAERQQVVRYDRETQGLLSRQTENQIIDRINAALNGCHAVILSDYGKGMICPRILGRTIALARKRRIPVTVDPKVEHFKLYRGVSCITPNLSEAWSGMRRNPESGEDKIEALGRSILKTLRSDSVLITRGPDGMSLFESNGRRTHIPTRAREVFDVTGAGDTVIAALTLALACGGNVHQAAIIANHAAGIVVGKLGTAVTTADELLGSLSRHRT